MFALDWTVDEVPNGVATTTATWPADSDGAVTSQNVSVHLTTAAAVDPKLTDVSPVKPEPTMVTGVPPAIDPIAGETPVPQAGSSLR